MKDHSSSTISTAANTNISKNRGSRTNMLEIYYNENLDNFLKLTEFKEFKLNQKQEYEKNDDSDINILCIEDLDLRDALKAKDFAEKDFNVVNSFLRIEEEEILNLKNNNLNRKNSKDGNDGNSQDRTGEYDGENFILNQINNKLFKDDEFKPGLFTSFDFKDRIKSIINSSFNTYNNNNSDINLINKINDKNISDSDYEKKLPKEINDSFILDTCFSDKNITYDNIIINFDKEIKKDKKETSLSEGKKLDFELFIKSEAIPEYENQIISYQNLNYIEKQKSIDIYPEHEDQFNRKLFEYFVKVSKEIKDEGLKNKVKLVLKLILYKDPKSKKYIFDNKIKNQLLNYWKNKYEKELSEATFREKSRILQEKLDRVNPNNKLLEMGKKLAENKRKANIKKKAYNRVVGQMSGKNLIFSVKTGDKKNYSKFTPFHNSKNNIVKNNTRRFSTGNNSIKLNNNDNL